MEFDVKQLKHYYNEHGKTNWPPFEGFVDGTQNKTVLSEGSYFDRYGSPSGKYASPELTPYEQRSLAPGSYENGYHVYRVCDGYELTVIEGEVAPGFGQPGGRTQYRFNTSFEDLIKWGAIEEVYI